MSSRPPYTSLITQKSIKFDFWVNLCLSVCMLNKCIDMEEKTFCYPFREGIRTIAYLS